MTETQPMTSREAADLAAHARRLAVVAKELATMRGAELLADFESQLAREFAWDESEVWDAALKAAVAATMAANAKIAEECAALGIPPQFAPRLTSSWSRRGENVTAERRTELRRAATARINALTRRAKAEVDRQSLDIQSRLLAGQLSTEDARAFLDSMPSAEALMPRLELADVSSMRHLGSGR